MEGKKKNSPPLLPQTEKKPDSSILHMKSPHWRHETFISKIVCRHFWPGLMAGAETVGHRDHLHSYSVSY
jgi:hypothetical protein